MLVKLKEYGEEYGPKHWPLIPAILSAGVLAMGVAFGAAGQFMIPVGASNFPMVLALAGSSLAIIAAFLYTGTYLFIPNKAHGKETGVIIVGLITAALVIGCGYAAVHFGFKELLPTSLSMGESLGAQAGIGFGIGFIPTAILCLIFNTDNDTNKLRVASSLLMALSAGLLVAASSALGPTLVAAMGTTVAANATEAVALEATISVGIAFSSLLVILSAFELGSYIDNNAGECGKVKTA